MTAHAHTATTDPVLAEVRNQVGHLTLNRPAGLNALTLDMVRNLRQHLDLWAEDPQVRAVVLRGEGPKGSVPVAISARCTTASKPVIRCMKRFSSRNMPSTCSFITTASRYWC